MKRLLLTAMCIVFPLQLFSQLPLWFDEEFNEHTRGWSEKEHESYTTKIVDGAYKIQHKRESGSWNFWISQYIDQDKDFIIESKITETEGITNHGYGLIWGTKNVSNSYGFIVSSDNHFQINRRKGGDFEKLYGWKETTAIKPNNEANILKIKKSGDSLYFYANDILLHTMSRKSFNGSKIGFVLNNAMTVKVDYIKVYQDISINLVDNPINGYKPENLGRNINSEYDEIKPIISPDGKTLFINRKDHPENIGNLPKDDIWYSVMDNDGNWTPIQNIGPPLNNAGHNSVISVSPDNKNLLVMNTYNSDGTIKGSGISQTSLTQNGWTLPREVKIEDYYNDNKYSNFYLSADKNYLIMAIERKDSYGDQDLYISFKTEDGYSKPLNMGPVINTYETDMSPFLAADNRTLYYSTKGKAGYGDCDIFVTKRLDDTWTNWSEPKNLGPEINTCRWDAYYSIPASGEYAMLSSSKNSYGKGDIYKIIQPLDARPDPVVLIYGKVLNAKTNKPLEADIIYSYLETDKVAGKAKSEADNGSYKIILPYGEKYSFLASKNNFYSISENMDVSDITHYMEIEKDLYLSPIEVGEVIRLNNIFFDYNSSELKMESYAELNRLIKILEDYPNMVIEISGHTDSDGADSYNQNLSEERVGSVLDYLVEQGVLKARLQGKGYGESKPLVTNDTDEGKARNRRVEFKILKK